MLTILSSLPSWYCMSFFKWFSFIRNFFTIRNIFDKKINFTIDESETNKEREWRSAPPFSFLSFPYSNWPPAPPSKCYISGTEKLCIKLAFAFIVLVETFPANCISIVARTQVIQTLRVGGSGTLCTNWWY